MKFVLQVELADRQIGSAEQVGKMVELADKLV